MLTLVIVPNSSNKTSMSSSDAPHARFPTQTVLDFSFRGYSLSSVVVGPRGGRTEGVEGAVEITNAVGR